MDNLDNQQYPQQPQQPQYGQQGQYQQQYGNTYYVKPSLPDDSLILGLGIGSIVCLLLGFCGPLGIVLSIIAMSKAKKAKQLYFAHLGKYDNGSLGMVNGGNITAIIGLVINGLITLFLLGYFVFFIGFFGLMAAGA